MSSQDNLGPQVQELMAPPRALISRNPLMWLRFFGPGAVMASLNIGTGEILFPSRSGAIFGYRILWVFLFIAVLKWVLAYSSMRHMVLSGAHPYRRWTSLPGPRGWLPLFIIAIGLITLPVWNSFFQGVLGTFCTWIFGFGDHYFWATVCVGIVLVLLSLGGYELLEKVQLLMLSVMLLGILVATFYVRPDWFAALKGLLLPQPLNYPEWLFEKLTHMRDRSVLVEVSVYMAAIGGMGYDYLGYLAFLREKRWGRSGMGVASQEELAQTAAKQDHPARVWVKAALIDTTVSFAMIVLVAACFAVLGTVILQPAQQVPDGVDLLNYQASFLTTLSPWLLPLYQLAVFLSFFGSLYASPELSYHILNEYLNTLPRFRGRFATRKLRWVVILWNLLGALSLLWLTRAVPDWQLIDIATPAGIYAGVLLCSFYCFANLWADLRFLPRELRMSQVLMALNVIGGVSFAVMGLWALWDYDQIRGFVVLVGLVAFSMLLASRLGFLYVPRSDSETAESSSGASAENGSA